MKRKFLVLLLLLCIIFTACSSPSKRSSVTSSNISRTENTAEFHFIDVGQGDCVLITDGDTSILIDAGTYESGSRICKYLEDNGIDSIDYFIGTHPHDDHLGGAAAVLTLFEADNVFLNGESSTAHFYERLVDTLISRKITPYIPETGKVYKAGPFEIEIISPDIDFEDTNNNSLVTMITYKNVKALFTGDTERKVESYFIEHGYDLSADILHVGHHGSRNGSSMEFLKAVNPTLAVIQCGIGNSYGHPHEEVLQRFKEINTPVYRTDTSGTIVIRTDGTSLYDASGEFVEKGDSAKEEKEETPGNINTTDSEYIGNVNSKVFHSLQCPNLPAEKNQIKFSDRDAALQSGYKACGNCNP